MFRNYSNIYQNIKNVHTFYDRNNGYSQKLNIKYID